MASNNAAAPHPGKDGGAGATKHTRHDSTARRPMCQRPLPADDLTCYTLAALRFPEARARFRELGIGPEAFEFSDERAIAAALLGERPFDDSVNRLLDRDDGRHLPWRGAIGWTLDQEHAVDIVNRFAAARARAWFPRLVNWALEGLAQGRPLSWVARELEWALLQVRPVMQAEGRP